MSIITGKFNRSRPAVSVEMNGDDRLYRYADGSSEIRHRDHMRDASRSWMNNNPGNLQDGAFARRHGAIGTDGRYAIFPDEETGFKAQEALLRERYNNVTIAQMMEHYSPRNENDTDRYVAYIESQTGLSRGTKISDLNDGQLHTMMKAMAREEGWKPGQVVSSAGAPRPETPVEKPAPAQKIPSAFDEAVSRHLGDGRVHTVNGTVTKYGISQAANSGIDVAHLTKAEAVEIYRARYWNKIHGIDNMPREQALAAFEIAYRHGAAYANRVLAHEGQNDSALGRSFLRSAVDYRAVRTMTAAKPQTGMACAAA